PCRLEDLARLEPARLDDPPQRRLDRLKRPVGEARERVAGGAQRLGRPGGAEHALAGLRIVDRPVVEEADKGPELVEGLDLLAGDLDRRLKAGPPRELLEAAGELLHRQRAD